ncbi:caspase-7 [Patella vulgata]|uniref:caspase-7 n=1 Tax=Patella vulgata TaxID=6465 RepID=UPI00217F2A1B|nr:caspase-7 [Patella vulgata]
MSGEGDAVDARPVMPSNDNTDARGYSSRPSGGTTAPVHNEEPMQLEENFYTEEYNMNHPKRGKAIIINNKNFKPRTQMSVRTGTDKDKNDLHLRFNELGFHVVPYSDLPRAEMERVLREAASENHGDSDCFMCAILSHGEEGTIYGTDGPIEIKTLLAPFKGDKCRSLAGKPKIFFIQACRGTQLDQGVERTDALPEVREIKIQRIPTEADFLIAYSVVPGYFSWRNSANGSWFVQAISEVFKKYGTELDLMTMMTRVNKKVAFDFESNASQEFMNRKKQIPCITSMLTKDVYFRAKPL